MAKKRRFSAYRNKVGPAYTRTSRYRAKSFIRMNKNPRIIKWHMGNLKKDFEYKFNVVSKGDLQIRDLAIESSRMVCNRVLEKHVGKENYYFHLRLYPHHILRENALAAGAGADRLSTGMSHCFGKTVGVAARVKKGQSVAEVRVDKKGLELGKKAASLIKTKLPGTYTIVLEKVEKAVA
ncbi:50S ribosomal protein L16 [Candidatus Woesearchaeota archaeon]|nr:50S ribosomal protein L16 [Candidatus Woesearchaeota archaeon]